MKRFGQGWWAVPLLLAGLAVWLYWAHARPGIGALHAGGGDPWLRGLVERLYPRFAVERHRFEADFFVRKADQLLLRALLAGLLAGFLAWRRRAFWAFWAREAPVGRVAAAHRLLLALALLGTWDWGLDLIALRAGRFFYAPEGWMAWLPYPGNDALLGIWGLYLLSGLWLFTLWRPLVPSLLFALLFFVQQGYLQSFEKADHGYATVGYVLLAWPAALRAWGQAHRARRFGQAGWPIWLGQALVAGSYAQSGLEKLLASGGEWLSGGTLRAYLGLSGGAGAEWLLGLPEGISAAMACGALLLQLSFPAVLWAGRWRWLWLAGGWAFHAGVYWAMGVGGWISPWIAAYSIFWVFPLEGSGNDYSRTAPIK
jgi:hypothetical protein